ncbi:hypothetical protein LZ198_18395 [Myxococcus sp. K15C18031901]|uniref:hypothetical protein n=1 Tax=Myxococcus dinghuensis TaxID=2906761 RepID=UPI0020A734FD|nr:hypothetical protein [Myxococcus dinghuensis]MCP3100844.1 hypothetical protein [Myxococcus dinghuensis]
MRRFPLRTLLLMLVGLIAFGRLWCVTHPAEAPRGGQATAPSAPPPPPAAPTQTADCRALERTLLDTLRAPSNGRSLDQARKQLESCAEPPARACELGLPLSARAPLGADGQQSPLRQLFGTLCERCPAAQNPCAQRVGRALLDAAVGHTPDLAELRWDLDHAGKGLAASCDSVTQLGLAPAAEADVEFPASVRTLVGALTPRCAKEGKLSEALLRAAAVNQGPALPELATLVPAAPATAATAVKPDRLEGVSPQAAFDGNVDTRAAVGGAPRTRRWDADGALRADFSPALGLLSSVRIHARGPGTLRAIVRTPNGVGLRDPERDFSFVNPVVCRFQGTGTWETCTPSVPLKDVDALSVFPERPDVVLGELEVLGAR